MCFKRATLSTIYGSTGMYGVNPITSSKALREDISDNNNGRKYSPTLSTKGSNNFLNENNACVDREKLKIHEKERI